MPFDVKHDCQEPLGFLIFHKEMGLTLFATDCFYLKYKFSSLNQIMLECNYSDEIIEKNLAKGLTHDIVMRRTAKSHMSLATCKKTLLANDLRNVSNILLIHLSDTNSDSRLFKSEIQGVTGKIVHIAEKGLEIDFNKEII